MSELNEQILVVQWFKLQYPKFANCIISIMNERKLGGSYGSRCGTMKKLKKAALKPGVSDLFIAIPAGKFHGLWLEMKADGKTWCSVTKLQRQHFDDMREVGYFCDWAAGADIAIKKIKAYMDLLND